MFLGQDRSLPCGAHALRFSGVMYEWRMNGVKKHGCGVWPCSYCS